jgi:predicted transcriptional regulator
MAATQGDSPDVPTPSEWKVLKLVWGRRECAAREVCADAARDFGWSASTTKTLLRRLVDRGALTARPVGNSFLYRPSSQVVPSLLTAADALLDRLLDGTTGLVLSHLVKNSRLSTRELVELRDLLDAHRPESLPAIDEEGRSQ